MVRETESMAVMNRNARNGNVGETLAQQHAAIEAGLPLLTTKSETGDETVVIKSLQDDIATVAHDGNPAAGINCRLGMHVCDKYHSLIEYSLILLAYSCAGPVQRTSIMIPALTSAITQSTGDRNAKKWHS